MLPGIEMFFFCWRWNSEFSRVLVEISVWIWDELNSFFGWLWFEWVVFEILEIIRVLLVIVLEMTMQNLLWSWVLKKEKKIEVIKTWSYVFDFFSKIFKQGTSSILLIWGSVFLKLNFRFFQSLYLDFVIFRRIYNTYKMKFRKSFRHPRFEKLSKNIFNQGWAVTVLHS